MPALVANDSGPLLEMQGVTLRAFGGRDRLSVRGIGWEVAAGEFWVVAGHERTGKTDLIAAAAALTKPAEGTVKLFGREISALHAEDCLAERLRVGCVFEAGGRLFNQLTVHENISLPLRYHWDCGLEEVEDQVRALLMLGQLESVVHERPAHLGHAARQRLALARALALKPELLLLDNPLTGLDRPQLAWWLATLEHLRAGHPAVGGKPLTMAVTTTSLGPWRGLANRFAMLQHNEWRTIPKGETLDSAIDPDLKELLH